MSMKSGVLTYNYVIHGACHKNCWCVKHSALYSHHPIQFSSFNYFTLNHTKNNRKKEEGMHAGKAGRKKGRKEGKKEKMEE